MNWVGCESSGILRQLFSILTELAELVLSKGKIRGVNFALKDREPITWEGTNQSARVTEVPVD